MENKIVLITGGSSGFGYLASIILAKKGYKVYAASRRIELMEPLKEYGIIPLKLDVTDDESCKEAVDTIIKNDGKIDILVNNAGYGALGPVETMDIEEVKNQIDVNVIGIGRMVKICAPYMREQGSGRIVNIGSLAGKHSMYMGGWYSATKYALEGLTDAMRMELKKFGIKVVLVEPGPFASNWGIIASEKIRKYSVNTPYEDDAKVVADAYEGFFSKKNLIVKDPMVAAKKIVKASTKKHPKARYKVGSFAYTYSIAQFFLPTRLLDRIATKTYSGKIVKHYLKKNAKNKQ